MTPEQEERVIAALERIADALEPRQRPQNPMHPKHREQIERLIDERIERDKIKVPRT